MHGWDARARSLDVALNNCIGAGEGRKVRARRHEPIISPDVSACSPFNRSRPIEPFRARVALSNDAPVLLWSVHASGLRDWGVLRTISFLKAGKVAIRYFIEESWFNEKSCAIYFSLRVNQIFRIGIILVFFTTKDKEALIVPLFRISFDLITKLYRDICAKSIFYKYGY